MKDKKRIILSLILLGTILSADIIQVKNGLHHAIRSSDLDVVKSLVEKGLDIDKQDKHGYTPLHLAVRYHLDEIVKYLVSKGANVNTNDIYSDTPLLDAVRNNDTNIAKTLICNDAMIKNIKDTQGVSIIEYSDTNDNKYLSKLLTDNNISTLCSNKKSKKKEVTLIKISKLAPEPIMVQSVKIEEITLYNELLDMLQSYDATMNEDHLSIIINNSLVFSKNRSILSKKGKSFIQNFYPQYLDKLLKYQSKIENIIIEVHASSDNRTAKTKEAKYKANQQFTNKRANKLLVYMKQIDNPLIKNNKIWIKNTHEAKGISSKEIIYNDNKEDKILSQRIKIKIKFKKEEN